MLSRSWPWYDAGMTEQPSRRRRILKWAAVAIAVVAFLPLYVLSLVHLSVRRWNASGAGVCGRGHRDVFLASGPIHAR